jgi:putative phosphoesterase
MSDHVIGVISDTHGLLRPNVADKLCGVERIIHAGDVGNPDILDQLENIAPVVAVRGNVDRGAWAQTLPVTEIVEVGNRLIYLLHDLNTLDLDPVAAGIAVVISGHTHRPLAEERRGVLYLNPGSIGPQRFTLPVRFAKLHLGERSLRVEWVDLDD